MDLLRKWQCPVVRKRFLEKSCRVASGDALPSECICSFPPMSSLSWGSKFCCLFAKKGSVQKYGQENERQSQSLCHAHVVVASNWQKCSPLYHGKRTLVSRSGDQSREAGEGPLSSGVNFEHLRQSLPRLTSFGFTEFIPARSCGVLIASGVPSQWVLTV